MKLINVTLRQSFNEPSFQDVSIIFVTFRTISTHWKVIIFVFLRHIILLCHEVLFGYFIRRRSRTTYPNSRCSTGSFPSFFDWT